MKGYCRASLVLFLVFVCSFFLQRTASAGDELVVVLDTQAQLIPIIVPDVYEEHPKFSSSYINQLRNVFVFDMNYNGMTEVVKSNSDIKQLAKKEGFAGITTRDSWKKFNSYYVIKLRILDNQLCAKICSIGSGTVKTTPEISLQGDLSYDRRRIHQLSDTIFKALFSKNGIASTRILYTLTGEEGPNKKSEIYEADYDGGNAHQVTHDGHYCVSPTYLPPKPGFTSGSFFYVSYRNSQPKIYVASLQDGVGRRFTYLTGDQFHPAVTLDRDLVAFISDNAGNPDIFVQNFSPEMGALGKPRLIFTSSGAQGSPSFSPDGRSIAFVSNMDGSPRIYTMEIPKTPAKSRDIRTKLITKKSRENTSPSWSPDGKKITYSAKVANVRQIWVYDFQTGEETQLTFSKDHKENPCWAPNSLHIVYNTANIDNPEETHLYIINLKQKEPVKIVGGKGLKRFPAWEPRPQ